MNAAKLSSLIVSIPAQVCRRVRANTPNAVSQRSLTTAPTQPSCNNARSSPLSTADTAHEAMAGDATGGMTVASIEQYPDDIPVI